MGGKEGKQNEVMEEGCRGVNDSGPESAPEYEFGSFLEIFDGDSGSGSFQVWSRFQAGIGSRLEKSRIRNRHQVSLEKSQIHTPEPIPGRNR